MKLSKFKEFLKENQEADDSEDVMSSIEMAQVLTRTLGRRFRASGWSTGSKGSGIVALTSSDHENAEQEAISIIEKWLKSQNLPYKMKPGTMSDSMIVRYKGNIISLVTTDVGFKVIVN